MRPIRLEMEGFATFRERTELDFGDLDLVAFVGATGAGKSTIIDAITFALYGSVARYDNANVVAPVIHQLSTEAKVRFDFEVAGEHYVAVRVVRRRGSRSKAATDAATGGSSAASSGGASTKEARLERLVSGESAEVLAGNVRELDSAVAGLLGLDFGQFTRTVVLPQGQFAQFLKDEPSSRQKLLRSLLDLDVYHRMGVVAREEAKKAGQQSEALESELTRQEPVTDTQLKDLASLVEALAAVRETAAGQLKSLADLDAELDPVREQVNEIDAGLKGLEGISVPETLTETDRSLAQADARLMELEAELAEARGVWEREQDAVQSGPDRAELQRTLDAIEQLASIESDRVALVDRVTGLQEDRADLAAKKESAESEAVLAQKALTDLRRSADAEVWIAQLEAGEPCPICRQTVENVPDHLADGALADAEARVAAVTATVAELAGKLSEVEARHRVAVDQQQTTAAQAEKLQATIGGQKTEDLTKTLGDLEQRATAAKAAYDTMTGLEQKLKQLRSNRDQLVALTQKWNVDFGRQRDAVSSLEPPSPEHKSLLEDWASLSSWAGEQQQVLSERRVALAEKGKDLVGRRKQLLSDLGELAAPFGVDPDPGRLLESLAVARSQVAGELEATEARRDDQKRLQAKVDELSADREINRALGQHLSASGFEGWLLNEALDNIVNRATGWLRDLSGGSYSLAVNNREFAIIDHNNADEQRDVRTLSGGETFLTSLSLALALADSIAELAPIDAPRLQSMFLDEGFGTLDGATLDVVASAIEELASTGRMIGIVTHVRDLAERLPARFEVTKSTAGSSVELVQL